MATPRRLFIKKTSNKELYEKWNFNPSLMGALYIRCNAKGEINWDKAPVFRAETLVGRDNVIIMT